MNQTDFHHLVGKHVLIVVENLPVPFDRRVWLEATTLKKAGMRVSVICPTTIDYSSTYEVIDDISIYRHKMPAESPGALGYIKEYTHALYHQVRLAIKIFNTQRFHILHACNPPDLIWIVALPFKLLFGVKIIFDHHDINPELFEAKFGKKGFFHSLLLLMERATFKFADTCIATNESYKEIAITRGKKRADDVFVVRSGPKIDVAKQRPINPKWRGGRRFLVGYVGVIGEQEGLDLLVKSINFIVKNLGRSDIQFIVVGDGPALRSIVKLAEAEGVLEFITFTGRVSDEVLFEVLSTSDVCVNPDKVNEMNDKSTMNKILEYMAFSKPIVQFDVTEGRRSAGAASLYAAPNDSQDFAEKILRVLDSPSVSRQMGEIGRHRLETQLSWEHQVDTLLAAYSHAISRKSGDG